MLSQTVTETPEGRPTQEDAVVHLIVEMRRNNLPAPMTANITNEGVSVELSSAAKVAQWAKYLGAETSARQSAVGVEILHVTQIPAWHGRHLRVYAYESPMSAETAALVDELAASVTS